jgi:hypothetical protein
LTNCCGLGTVGLLGSTGAGRFVQVVKLLAHRKGGLFAATFFVPSAATLPYFKSIAVPALQVEHPGDQSLQS